MGDLSAHRRRVNHQGPLVSEPPFVLLRRGGPPTASWNPHPSRGCPTPTAVTSSPLLPHAAKEGATRICRSNKPPRLARPHSTAATATDLRWIFVAALDAIVIPIALCDLLLLVLLLALSPPPVRGHLVALEDRLLRERCLCWHKVGAPQLNIKKQKEFNDHQESPRRSKSNEDTELVGELIRGRNHSRASQSPRWGASAGAKTAAP